LGIILLAFCGFITAFELYRFLVAYVFSLIIEVLWGPWKFRGLTCRLDWELWGFRWGGIDRSLLKLILLNRFR